MKYLILTIPSVDYAKSISRWLYALSVPTLDESTVYFNNWIEHPNTKKVALVFNNALLPVHQKANAEALVQQIASAITEEEASELKLNIEQSKGKSVNPFNFIPNSLGGNLKTYKQMLNWGWFEEV